MSGDHPLPRARRLAPKQWEPLVCDGSCCGHVSCSPYRVGGWCSTWFFVKWGTLAPVKPSVMLAELHERLGAYMFDYYAVISVRPEAPPLYDILVRVEARTGSGDVRRLLSLEGSTVFDPGVSCVWKVTCCQAALETDVGFMLKHFEPGPDRFFFGNEILADKLKLDVHAALA